MLSLLVTSYFYFIGLAFFCNQAVLLENIVALGSNIKCITYGCINICTIYDMQLNFNVYLFHKSLSCCVCPWYLHV